MRHEVGPGEQMLRMCGAVTVSMSVVLGRNHGAYDFPWTRCWPAGTVLGQLNMSQYMSLSRNYAHLSALGVLCTGSQLDPGVGHTLRDRVRLQSFSWSPAIPNMLHSCGRSIWPRRCLLQNLRFYRWPSAVRDPVTRPGCGTSSRA